VTVDAVRSAYQSLGEGDVEPVVLLIHPDMEWRGRRRLRRFRRAPACHGPDEAREVLNGGISKRRMNGDRDYKLDSVQSRGDRVVVTFSWSDRYGKRHNWAQALRLKDGKIIDMQDFAHPGRAVALMRARTVFA